MLSRITLPVFLTHLVFSAQLVDANPIRYVAIGDSYAVATGIEEKDSWPTEVRRLANRVMDLANRSEGPNK